MELIKNIKHRRFASEMKLKFNFSINKDGTVSSFKACHILNNNIFIEKEYQIYLN